MVRSDSGSQSLAEPTASPSRIRQRQVTIGPNPTGSNRSGPTRSSARSQGPRGPGDSSRRSSARAITKERMPHSTGVTCSRPSAGNRSKPSMRSTSAWASGGSMPRPTRVESLGQVSWAITPGRPRPAPRQWTSKRSAWRSSPRRWVTPASNPPGPSLDPYRPSRCSSWTWRRFRLGSTPSGPASTEGRPSGELESQESGPSIALKARPPPRPRLSRSSLRPASLRSGVESRRPRAPTIPRRAATSRKLLAIPSFASTSRSDRGCAARPMPAARCGSTGASNLPKVTRPSLASPRRRSPSIIWRSEPPRPAGGVGGRPRRCGGGRSRSGPGRAG